MSDEAQLAAIVNSSDDAIISYTLDGTIMTWNPAATRLYGYLPDEAVGEKVDILEPPDVRGTMLEIIARIAAGHPGWCFDTRRMRKDGSIVHVQITVSPIRDRSGVLLGVSGISRDISRQVEMQRARERAEQQLRAVMDSVIDSIVASDASGNIIAWNKGAERMFGYTADEVIGKPLEILMPERHRGPHRAAMDRVSGGGEPRLVGSIIPLEAVHKNGSEFAIDLSLGMWRDETGVFYSGVIRDRTVRYD